jgi:hypothetical protein
VVGTRVVDVVEDVEVVVVGTRVVDVVEDVEVVVVGTRVVDVVEDVEVVVVGAPLRVTLITFDGPLSEGAAGSAAWLSATSMMVNVSVCPAAGSTTKNVCAQGVGAQTTAAGWLSTRVQVSGVDT